MCQRTTFHEARAISAITLMGDEKHLLYGQ